MKDEHTYIKKGVKKGHTEVIYKETFISKQSLLTRIHLAEIMTAFFKGQLALYTFQEPSQLDCTFCGAVINVKRS